MNAQNGQVRPVSPLVPAPLTTQLAPAVSIAAAGQSAQPVAPTSAPSSAPTPAVPKIYGAMVAVMKRVGAVGKNHRNREQNYGYRSLEDVYAALQKVMAEEGVFSLPEVLAVKREERPTHRGGVLIYAILRVRFTFYAADGSSLQALTVGEAMDSGDKATNKAMSAAEKYALVMCFKIPTAELRDSESESPRPAPRQANGNGQPARPAAAPTPARPSTPPPPSPRPANGFEGVVRQKLQDRGLKGAEIDDALAGIADSYQLGSLDHLDPSYHGRVLRGIVAGGADRWMKMPGTPKAGSGAAPAFG